MSRGRSNLLKAWKMNSEWAKNLAERKKSELEAKRLQQEKDLNDRKLLDTNADKMLGRSSPRRLGLLQGTQLLDGKRLHKI